MNPWLTSAVAQTKAEEIRHQAERHRAGASAPAPGPDHRSRPPGRPVRRRVGFLLVEAGLRLVSESAASASRSAANGA